MKNLFENLKERTPFVRWGTNPLTKKEKQVLERLSRQANAKLDGSIDLTTKSEFVLVTFHPLSF